MTQTQFYTISYKANNTTYTLLFGNKPLINLSEQKETIGELTIATNETNKKKNHAKITYTGKAFVNIIVDQVIKYTIYFNIQTGMPVTIEVYDKYYPVSNYN